MRIKIVTLLLVLLFAACSDAPPAEVAIARNIEAIQNAIEEKNRSDVMEHIAEDFTTGSYLNREELGKMLVLQFLAHNKITVTIVKSDIQLEPGHTDIANALLSVIVTGATRLIPNDGRIYQVSARWQQNNGEWMLNRLSWE
ncbi:MAG: hypothetical protein OQK78_06375 [Gammaproteobacteria bacterium]|nr:hypothetical protein [Gammaproteobacteria bacterium]